MKLAIVSIPICVVLAGCPPALSGSDNVITVHAPGTLVDISDADANECANGGKRISTGTDADANGRLDTGEVSKVTVVCNGTAGSNAIVQSSIVAPGADCPAGGFLVQGGTDGNRDGVLDQQEISASALVCNGAAGSTSLVTVTDEAAGAHCANGGKKFEIGRDLDGNGVLDPGEILRTDYVCNGANGASAAGTLVRVSAVPSGANCALGGVLIETGADDDLSGTLENTEVDHSEYVCHGASGGDGSSGLVAINSEPPGANCTNGGRVIQSGLDANRNGVLDSPEVSSSSYICDLAVGQSGRDSLISVTAEPAGPNCGTGGSRVEVGLDADADGLLDASEVSDTSYVCNGNDGRDGTNGLNTVVRVSAEVAGANCASGGVRVDTGLDLNANNTLDPMEISASSYVCNGSAGSDGTDGLTSLVRVTAEPAGPNCVAGGRQIASGLDANQNNVLDSAEIAGTNYVCNGQNGTNGTNGTNGLNSLVRTSVEAAGANCSAGGVRVDNGLDANANGVLDAGEISSTRFVCNGASGASGMSGTNGLNSLVSVSAEAAGTNCTFGGQRIRSGLDTNSNGTLDTAEVASTSYVCNGATATDAGVDAGVDAGAGDAGAPDGGCALLAATVRVSVSSAGAEANGASNYDNLGNPSVSANGRLVAFLSNATNLVAGDTNSRNDVFIRDLQSGTTARVNVDSAGAQASAGVADGPSMSADGRYVAWNDSATNLVSGDTNSRPDIFVRDRTLNQTVRVSVNSAGTQANGDCVGAQMSDDGNFVVFESIATNLDPLDNNTGFDIYIRDRVNNQTSVVSRTLFVLANGNSQSADVNADGRYVVFESAATNLVASDTNGFNDIFRGDRQTGSVALVSIGSGGAEANAASHRPSISADGRYVSFYSAATNLVQQRTAGDDEFVRDMQTGETHLVSINLNAEGSGGVTGHASISANGRFIAFLSGGANIVAGDNDGATDVFVRDMLLAQTSSPTFRLPFGPGVGHGTPPSISGDGRVVAYLSDRADLVSGDANGVTDVFASPVAAACN